MWTQIRSRVSSTQFVKRLAWLLLVIIVAAFAISVFHMFRQTLDAVAAQQ